jgi:hypothetical protein
LCDIHWVAHKLPIQVGHIDIGQERLCDFHPLPGVVYLHLP